MEKKDIEKIVLSKAEWEENEDEHLYCTCEICMCDECLEESGCERQFRDSKIGD